MSVLSDDKVRELLKVAEARKKHLDWVTVTSDELIALCKVYLAAEASAKLFNTEDFG